MVIFQVNLGHPVPPSDPPPPPVLLLVKRVFYELEVLPATQPSVSKHWREHEAMTITGVLASFFLHSQLVSWMMGHCFLDTDSPTPVPHNCRTMTGSEVILRRRETPWDRPENIVFSRSWQVLSVPRGSTCLEQAEEYTQVYPVNGH